MITFTESKENKVTTYTENRPAGIVYDGLPTLFMPLKLFHRLYTGNHELEMTS